MIIDIFGVHSKLTATEIHDAVEFFANELLPKEAKKLHIEVNIESDRDINGSAVRYSKYSYGIDIAKRLGKKTTISTIAHEMVHVKQYVLNELGFYSKYNIWRNKKYEKDEDYFFVPWEIEAYGMEVGLSHKYWQHQKGKL